MMPEVAKSESQKFLRDHDIPINEHLPQIEPVSELKPQNAQAVARRCVVLSYVIGIAYGADVAKLNQYLKDVGLIEYASSMDRWPNITFEADAVTRTRRFAVLSVAGAAQLPRWAS